MSKVIYVPQGYSARLMGATEVYDIKGLYTDGFSTCNIVACIGKDKLVLMHVDAQTILDKVEKEIAWVGEPSEVIVILRNEDVCSGERVKAQLLEHLNQAMPSLSIVERIMDREHDGVYLSFKQHKQSDLHVNLQKFPLRKRPDNLIHHPQEQQFLAVQKIEQIIGQREKYQTRKAKNKQFYIFDGRAWETLGNNELKIDCSHQLTREEMQCFAKDDPYIVISGKVGGIIESAQKKIPIMSDLKEIALNVATHLEGYLHDYDYRRLFKRNLKDMINNDCNNPLSDADKDFKSQLSNLLQQNADIFKEVEQLIATYQQNALETEFKTAIVSEYNSFSEHYLERKYYSDVKIACEQMKKRALSFNKQAVKEVQQKKYESAVNLFFDTLKLCTYCCMKDAPELAIAYFNFGRTLYRAGRYQEAHFSLNTSLLLRENYTQSKSNEQEIVKVKNALAECVEKLEEPVDSTLTKTFSL